MGLETTDVIGVMSGSSMDGLDLAVVRLNTEVTQGALISANYELLHGTTLPIPDDILTQLKDSASLNTVSLLTLDQTFGIWAGKQIDQVLVDTSFRPSLLGFHGHTVFHFPDKGVSLQLGHGAALSTHVRLPLVTDFRYSDMALGGQGAPMVSIAERWLWPQYSAFLNLGGICNLTLKNPEDKYLSSDIWVCNQILNHLAKEVGRPYDDRGQIAGNGQPIDELVQALLSAPWFDQALPKSLDNSFSHTEVLPVIAKFVDHDTADKLSSVCMVIAEAISRHVKTIYGHSELPADILVTGGGALNDFLVGQIQKKLSSTMVIPDADTLHFKEAIMVAFAGWLRWKGLPNFIREATGARENAVGGALYLPAVHRYHTL